MSEQCPLCEGAVAAAVPYLDAHWGDAPGIFRELTIRHCRECGLGWSAPELPSDTVGRFYETVYRGERSPFFTDFDRLGPSLSFDLRSVAQLILAKHFVTFSSGDVFVDIGPGPGTSFASALAVFERPRMLAVELNRGAAAAYARLYGVESLQDVANLRERQLTAKVILASHSLEHFTLGDLRAFLGGVRSVLAPDGVVVVEVPLVDLRVHAGFRFSDSPHFLFFSRDSLGRLFAGAGFEVVFLDSCSDTYAEWFGAAKSQYTAPATAAAQPRLRQRVRDLSTMLPQPVMDLARRVHARTLRQLDLRSTQFAYGGDRTCVRLVARPRSARS